MAFTKRLVVGREITWAEFDANLTEIEYMWSQMVALSGNALAATNFVGEWFTLTGPLSIPAATYSSGKFWMLLSNVADVTAHTPGVSAVWAELKQSDVVGPSSAVDGYGAVFDGATGKLLKSLGAAPVKKSGDTMTGPLAQAAGSAALPSYTFSGDVNTGIYSPGADILALSTAGTERLRIDTSGNVIVGSTANNDTRRVGFTTNTGGTSAIESVTTGATAQALVFKTTFATEQERLRITALGDVLVTGSGGLGYGIGSGGTVTQATSKSTAVALNKPSGTITMNAAALSAGATVRFTFSSTSIGLNDIVDVQVVGGAATRGTYDVWTDSSGLGAGSTMVFVKNISAGSLSEALVLSFSLGKVATS